ncbi:vWA domain-containing protein [Yoonia vestfoldensis]|uniref:vWA domain-containing protein n=1 Tax=Yoonia vestfoldensis TaxID=245188 RepID=UPI000370CBCD|nr:VWA domain-containing protein [Yoonia vestfoldensis]
MTRLIPALAALLLTAAPAMADRVAVLVFDASGSMWNRVEGDLTRIEVARDVMGDYFTSRDGAVPLSVIAYGHNRRGDCRDIEVVTPMGQGDAGSLESRLRGLMPRGMTPLTDSLALARDQIPPSAEAADIILVTDGLENCEGDPCALAASLAAEGIDIRAHVVGFGLSAVEVEALSCITDQTGGMLFQTNSGAELADALQQVSAVAPAPAEPAPPAAAFDIGDKAEAGFDYSIRWNGQATNVDYMGFVPQGESRAPASGSYRTIGGTGAAPNNPATRTAPTTPGMYDLILVTARDGVIARQPVEVVAPAMGFDPIGSVEPGSRVRFVFRGPEQLGERIVIADLDQPVNEDQRHGWGNAMAKNGAMTLAVPTTPGEYELRYLNAGATEVMFSRRFGVGVPFEDADMTTSADLAAQAAAATRGDAAQDDLALVTATFRLPPDVPQSDVTWDGVPLDADMSPEAWAPMDTGPVITGSFEPGNWRVTAYAPGEVTLSADVTIFPGQANDFTVQINASRDAGAEPLFFEGQWRVLAVPPRDAPAGAPTEPLTMMDVTIAANDAGTGYVGRFTPSQLMTGAPGAEMPLDAAFEEEAYFVLQFTLPAASPEPFILALQPLPFGDGYIGQMESGPNAMPVIFWRNDTALPPLSALQDELYGPASLEEGALQQDGGTVFACADSVCSWTDPASGVTVPLPQGWSVTAPEFQTASATPSETDLPSMSLFGPEGQELRLNPRMWIDSDGICHDTPDLGRLCHFKDADIVAQMTALMIAPMIARAEPVAGAQTRAVSVSLAGAPRDAAYDIEITLVSGNDPAHETTQRLIFQEAQAEYVLGVGNTYDLWAVSGTRQYRNRSVTVMPGNMVQVVDLAPVFMSDEVTLDFTDAQIVAGPDRYVPVTLTAPADFNGFIALHDADDRDAPAIFTIDAATLIGSQDPVLPAPDTPGFYEIRFLDMNGEMFGGTDFEAVAADTPAGQITVTPTGVSQFGTGCFISAALTGPEGGDYTMIAPVTATAGGQDIRAVLDPEAPLIFEIISFGSTGQSTANLMLMAPCEAITLDFALPQCAFREGDGIVTRDCPAPVVFAPLQIGDGAGTMADAITQGATEAARTDVEAGSPMTPEEIDAAIFDLIGAGE